MIVLVNGKETLFNEVEAIASINEVARQFTLVDVSESQNYFNDDVVEIYDDSGVLFIKANIEYIEADGDEKTSEFIYAGRNKAKYIVDCYAEKTTQFTQSQKMNTVLSEIATPFGVKIKGNAQMPQQDIKTIMIGDKIIDAFLEIAQSAGKIITSDAIGDLFIEFEAKDESNLILEYGTNVLSRKYVNNTSQLFDKYTIVAQSNYLVKQHQEVFNSGTYGAGKFHKVKVIKNTLTTKECEQLAEIEYKKHIRKSLHYAVKVNNIDLVLNTKYNIKDEAIEINEKMNCKTIKLIEISREGRQDKYTLGVFERVPT